MGIINIFKNKIAKNALWIIGCRLAQSVFALIINFLSARYLGPSNYGTISYVSSLVAIVVPIANLGLNNILVNEIISKDREEEVIGTSIGLTLISSIFCIAGLGGFVLIANAGEKETLIVCLLYSLLLIFQCTELIQYWFQAKYLSKYTALTTFGVYLIVSAYKIVLLINQSSIYWFALSNALDYCLISIVLFIIYKSKGGKKLKFRYSLVFDLLSKSKHYIIAGLMGTILAQTDRVMLKMINGNIDVGLYSAALSIAGLTSFVFSAIMDSMRPQIFENKRNECAEKYEQNISFLYSIIIYLALLQSIIISIFSEQIIKLLYGEEYILASSALQIVIWYTIFSYIGGVRAIWLLSENMQKYLWIISLTGMLLNIGLNFLFIPLYNINGAAMATLITQVFSNFLIGFIIKPIRRNNYLLLKGLSFHLLLKRKRK